MNRTFEWLWENTISYDKTFGKHTINFVGGISAQKNTWTGMGGVVFLQIMLQEIYRWFQT